MVKAYKDEAFMGSTEARPVRILAEYLRAWTDVQRLSIHDTIVFFGSARSCPLEEAQAKLKKARHEAPDNEAAIKQAERCVQLGKYYDDAVRLARRLTQWSMSPHRLDKKKQYIVCTGGGPGMMEAANRGAASVPDSLNMGLGISLPKEQGNNEFVSLELDYEFHYFFMRKLFLVYLCQAMVVMPGGWGSLDELFEVLCLLQTQKVHRPLPIVLFGQDFWQPFLDLCRHQIAWGTISESDLARFMVVDSVNEAFDYLTQELARIEDLGQPAIDRVP